MMTEHPSQNDVPEAAEMLTLEASTPLAPRWRRWAAHTIDLAIVAIVLALFLTPVITAYTRSGSVSGLLRASAWVYVAVFVAMGVSLVRGRKRERRYVTVGVNIMNLQPVRIDSALRFVTRETLPSEALGDERHGLAMAAIAAPLMLLGVAFFLFELFAYL